MAVSMNLLTIEPYQFCLHFQNYLKYLFIKRLIYSIYDHNIISESQFGFRHNRSTELATSYVISKLCNAIDHNIFSMCIYLDLSKAFDTVNHDILISKLEHYGVRGTALDLLKSYLCNRNQCASFHFVNSTRRVITCGVPQGSVLGPLLFILYINDICNTSDTITFCLFADDTSLLYTHNNIDEAIYNLNM